MVIRRKKPNRSQVARYLWMGSWLLEKEARTNEALAYLTGDHAAGQLSLSAGIEVVSWDSAAGHMRLRTSDKPQANLTLPVVFGPSEIIRIFVESSQVRGEVPRESALTEIS